MKSSLKRKLKARVQGRAMITGASSGIGKALASQLALAGIPVILADINEENGQLIAHEIMKSGGQAEFIRLDVTQREEYAQVIEFLEKQEQPVDLLISNAGIGTGGEVKDMTPKDWQDIFNVNLFGVVHGIDAIYPKMIKRGRGTIVNVASVAGLYPLPAEAAYAASKYAVVGLTKVLAVEAKAYGVDALLVCPGKIETPIYETSSVKGFNKTAVLDIWPQGITAEDCAIEILEGIAKGNPMIVITPLAKTLWAIERALPGLSRLMGDFYINKIRKHRV